MKNNCDNEINADELICAIKVALKDVFIAKIRETSDGIVLKFLNGQSFVVVV